MRTENPLSSNRGGTRLNGNRPLLAAAVVLAVTTAGSLRADVPHTFVGGETLSAAKLNENFGDLDTRLAALEAAQAANAAPPGTVVAFAGVVGGAVAPPAGWLLCDGAAVSRTTYAALFAAIGTTAGGGDGATTFNLPDYRGRFIRGVDQGVGRDPDAASRGAMALGGNTGDSVGTVESQALASHGHGVSDPGHSHPQLVSANPGACPGSGIIRIDYAGDTTNACGYSQGTNTAGSGTGVSVQSAGGAETRPLNASVNYLVKI